MLQAAKNAPHRADVQYLVGAECASAGRYELAIEQMQRAIELDPSLHTARLQLGLLYLTCARPAEALATWRPLEILPGSDPLRLFAGGLEALVSDDFRACIARLEAGIRANQGNPALSRDMALVIERVRATAGAGTAAGGDTADPEAVRTDFSLYQPKTRK
jgi:tetratricopeptide (TPR) repeat protein